MKHMMILAALLAASPLTAQTPRVEAHLGVTGVESFDTSEWRRPGWLGSGNVNLNSWLGLEVEASGSYGEVEHFTATSSLTGNLDTNVYAYADSHRTGEAVIEQFHHYRKYHDPRISLETWLKRQDFGATRLSAGGSAHTASEASTAVTSGVDRLATHTLMAGPRFTRRQGDRALFAHALAGLVRHSTNGEGVSRLGLRVGGGVSYAVDSAVGVRVTAGDRWDALRGHALVLGIGFEVGW